METFTTVSMQYCLNAGYRGLYNRQQVEVTPFFRTATDGADTEHSRVGGLWLVRSHSSFLFDTGQPLLVDFDFCFATILSPDAVGGL